MLLITFVAMVSIGGQVAPASENDRLLTRGPLLLLVYRDRLVDREPSLLIRNGRCHGGQRGFRDGYRVAAPENAAVRRRAGMFRLVLGAVMQVARVRHMQAALLADLEAVVIATHANLRGELIRAEAIAGAPRYSSMMRGSTPPGRP